MPSSGSAAISARPVCAEGYGSRTWPLVSAPLGSRIEDVAARIGASRFTVADLEKGKPGTSAAAYFGALWALGLLDRAIDLADPDRDEEGKVLEGARRPKQAPRRRSLDDDF